jgi:hypothetical protein
MRKDNDLRREVDSYVPHVQVSDPAEVPQEGGEGDLISLAIEGPCRRDFTKLNVRLGIFNSPRNTSFSTKR